MRNHVSSVWTGLVLMLASFAGATETPATRHGDPASMTVSDIGACMRANVVDRGSLRDFTASSIDADGNPHTLKFKLFWKRSKDSGAQLMTLQVVLPESSAGTSYLIESGSSAPQVQVYLPALNRTQTVESAQTSEPLWGTDFTFADVENVQGVVHADVTKRLADENAFDRKAFVLDTTTDLEKTGYSHVKSWVDQATCTLLKAEMHGKGDAPRKILEAELQSLLEIDPWWIILRYRMTDARTGSTTLLKMSDVYLNEKVPDSIFTRDGFFKPAK